MADMPSSIPGIGGPWSRGDDGDRDPRVIGVDGDDADAVLAALSSDTARAILSALHDSPGPASDVADRVDTSLQNTQYHLKRLREAGVVEVVDTVYSQKGREMDVYAPADGPLVLVAGPESEASGIRATLSRLLGGIGAVGLGAVVVETALGGPFAPTIGFGSAGGADGGAAGDGADVSVESTNATATEAPADDAATATATPTETAGDGGMGIQEATETAAETATPAPTSTPAATPTPDPTATELARDTTYAVAADAGPTLVDLLAASPGFLFLCGGLLALAVVALVARRRGGA
ncbi:ArsR/SmtB family transcription factor [Halobaculum magnesiiphilum]|uniref:Winged helix-turn-helix domain-containing protein n=1 Tax=Halobaculum magnesiiphilum TaxID=1017351 RepID=A0A8T8WA59_9EURY|nr:winged helix-turn-helix domain-containing protein [Halobaculum magnesiiphilum]QZP36644.1 winged helix-turn-helix domain-containing protein [Halobaculum magnesiiphilum]